MSDFNKIFFLIGVAVILSIALFFQIKAGGNAEEASLPKSYQNQKIGYVLSIPPGWYPHEVSDKQTIFTPSEKFTLPEGTEGYAVGRQMVVAKGSFNDIIGAGTFEDYLRGIGATPSGEFFVERRNVVTRTGIPMTRILMNAVTADGQTLTYAYHFGGRDVYLISHHPYVPETNDAKAFDAFVQSFALFGD